ncbi:hypothetical protein CXF96_12190 [Stenotrophomonas sp. Betaine-02u-21]|nr:hypothetical protein CXF96_12190 [Stenotrophomonas sp. Betaine-02u-21]
MQVKKPAMETAAQARMPSASMQRPLPSSPHQAGAANVSWYTGRQRRKGSATDWLGVRVY